MSRRGRRSPVPTQEARTPAQQPLRQVAGERRSRSGCRHRRSHPLRGTMAPARQPLRRVGGEGRSRAAPRRRRPHPLRGSMAPAPQLRRRVGRLERRSCAALWRRRPRPPRGNGDSARQLLRQVGRLERRSCAALWRRRPRPPPGSMAPARQLLRQVGRLERPSCAALWRRRSRPLRGRGDPERQPLRQVGEERRFRAACRRRRTRRLRGSGGSAVAAFARRTCFREGWEPCACVPMNAFGSAAFPGPWPGFRRPERRGDGSRAARICAPILATRPAELTVPRSGFPFGASVPGTVALAICVWGRRPRGRLCRGPRGRGLRPNGGPEQGARALEMPARQLHGRGRSQGAALRNAVGPPAESRWGGRCRSAPWARPEPAGRAG